MADLEETLNIKVAPLMKTLPTSLKRPGEESNLATVEQAKVRDWLEAFPSEAPVVVVPVYNAFGELKEALTSLLATCGSKVPVLVIDDGSDDVRLAELVEFYADRPNFYWERKPAHSGYVSTVNLAFSWVIPRDVVIVQSDVVVPAGWLERLRAAAYSHSTIATASAFSNFGGPVSLPERNQATHSLLKGFSLEEIDQRVNAASTKLRPQLISLVPHCVYIKRIALDVTGYFDEAFEPGFGEDIDFSIRATSFGFSHVLADDLFVYHRGCSSFTSLNEKLPEQLRQAHRVLLEKRYPSYLSQVEESITGTHSKLTQAFTRARAALLGYRIGIDATYLRGIPNGIQVVVLELIRALTAKQVRRDHLTLILDDGVPHQVLQGLEKMVDDIIRPSVLQDLQKPLFDLIHRPVQLNSWQDLELLRRAATRIIVTQLDFITYSNLTYYPDLKWKFSLIQSLQVCWITVLKGRMS